MKKQEGRTETEKTEPGITKQESRAQTTKAVPPAGLPFMHEVSKLTQTAELKKPLTDNLSPITLSGKSETAQPPQPQREAMPQPPQPTLPSKPQSAHAPESQTKEAGITNNESGIQKTIKSALPQSASAQKYTIDPYREPIE